MRHTVLGGRGFVGAHLAAQLAAQGRDVFVPTRDDNRILTENLGHVYYCIGLTADYRERPFDTVEAHVSLLSHLLQRAKFESFVYLSSTRVYINSAQTHEEASVTVSSLNLPDLYNLTKLTGESICFNSGRKNVRAVRLSNVIGPDTNSPNFIFDIARDALAGTIKLRSNPKSSKDYIGLDDVSRMLPMIAEMGKYNLYNLASGVNVSHQEWIDQLCSLTGCTFESSPDGETTIFKEIEIGRLRREFGFEPQPIFAYLPEIIKRLAADRNPKNGK